MNAVTIYGVAAITFMMVMYALEGRERSIAFGSLVGEGRRKPR